MFLPSIFLVLFSSSAIFADPINIELKIVDVLDRLGLADVNDTQGAAFDGRLEAILALGTKVYTARLGVGTPPQPVDFLLNWVGDLISPGVGDLSFVLSPNALHPKGNESAMAFFGAEENNTTTFNSSASKTFKSRPDVTFHTKIQPNPMNFSARGFFGEDLILFKDQNDLPASESLAVRDRLFGQVEQIQVSELFDTLSVGGMLSMSKQGALMANKRILLIYGKKEARMVIDPSRNIPDKLCQSDINYYDLKDYGSETGPGQDAYQFKIKGVNMRGPDMEYDDKIERTVLVNPNSVFIQGPRKTVAKMALMANAEKRAIGPYQFYTIRCDEQFGPLEFKLYRLLTLGKENLIIKLPGNLLPAGQCLWAIQELQDDFVDEATAPWIFGRPLFQQKYCLAIDPLQRKIAFPIYMGEK